jgi:ATP-binding cassette subfamily F protein 3
VVLVSHDRYILNQLVSEIIEVGHGQTVRYLGNYDEYLEKKAAEQTRADTVGANDLTLNGDGFSGNGGAAKRLMESRGMATRDGRAGYAKAREAERQVQRGRAKLSRRLAELEGEIEKKEAERAALSAEMSDPNFYLARNDAEQLISRYEQLGEEIDGLYQRLVSFDEASE